MIFSRFFSADKSRSTRRPTLTLESLEDRKLLSATGLIRAAQVQSLSHTHSVPLQGAITGGAALGSAQFDASGNAFVPVGYSGVGKVSPLGTVTISGTHVTEVLASTRYTTSAVVGGSAKITTSKGDSFNISYTGQGTLVPGRTNLFRDVFRYTITGGVGRFAGVGGSGVIVSTDLNGGTSTEIPFRFVLNARLLTGGSKS